MKHADTCTAARLSHAVPDFLGGNQFSASLRRKTTSRFNPDYKVLTQLFQSSISIRLIWFNEWIREIRGLIWEERNVLWWWREMGQTPSRNQAPWNVPPRSSSSFLRQHFSFLITPSSSVSLPLSIPSILISSSVFFLFPPLHYLLLLLHSSLLPPRSASAPRHCF